MQEVTSQEERQLAEKVALEIWMPSVVSLVLPVCIMCEKEMSAPVADRVNTQLLRLRTLASGSEHRRRIPTEEGTRLPTLRLSFWMYTFNRCLPKSWATIDFMKIYSEGIFSASHTPKTEIGTRWDLFGMQRYWAGTCLDWKSIGLHANLLWTLPRAPRPISASLGSKVPLKEWA